MLADFISMVFPEYCYACNESLVKGEQYICTHCRYQLPQTDYHKNIDNNLFRRFWGKVPLKYALSYFKYIRGGKVQQVLHKFKYEGVKELGELLGNWYGNILVQHKFNLAFDIIIPVPLHQKKLRKRGFNQSDMFAGGLSKMMDVEWSQHIMKREILNPTQTNKKRYQRYENVKGIFKVIAQEKITNKRVLIVDDVVTTGSTLEACAMTVLENGCKEVSIATIAAAQ
ncbi:MAG: ComF family protein [Cytophagales bacterium]|nr:ComF family protein [Cytophagales bacterium]